MNGYNINVWVFQLAFFLFASWYPVFKYFPLSYYRGLHSNEQSVFRKEEDNHIFKENIS